MAKDSSKLHIEYVDVNRLYDHPDNDYGLDESELLDLMDSIRREGLGQLPLVRPMGEGYQIIAGHRRVECYRRLSKEDAEVYGVMPVSVREDVNDELALVLLDVTNLMTRELTSVERAKKFGRIAAHVPEMRKRDPSLRGVRTNAVIADIITRETGKSISEATVKRAISAGKRVEESRQLLDEYAGSIISSWQEEMAVNRFPAELVREIATRDASVQRDLFADYQREQMTPKDLLQRLEYRKPKTDLDSERLLDNMIVQAREISKMKKVDGVSIDAYRLTYLINLLKKL